MRGGAFFNGKEGFCPLEGEPKGSKRLLKVGFRKLRLNELRHFPCHFHLFLENITMRTSISHH